MKRLLLSMLLGALANLSAETTEDLALYAPILKAAKTEPLSVAPDRTSDAECYQFYIFRSFEPAVIFTVSISEPKCQVEYKIVRNFGDLKEEYRLIQSSIINFPRSELQPLLELLKGAEFWKRPKTLSEEPSTDGSTWAVEGIKDGRHHLVVRSNPLSTLMPPGGRSYEEGLLVGAFFYLWGQTHQMDGELY